MNNNPFEAYDIEHFSASSINTYIQEPAMWVFRYLYKKSLLFSFIIILLLYKIYLQIFFSLDTLL